MEPSGYRETLDATFFALADPTRRAILARLASGDLSVAELAEPFDMTQPAVSKHLRVLERAGLIVRGKEAQRRPSHLEAKPLEVAVEWLESYRKFWERRFGALDSLLAEMKAVKSGRRPKARSKRGRKKATPRTGGGRG